MQERLKQLLKEKNLTATQLAALIKVNASAMSHILNGRSKPSYDMLNKIAQAFPDINLNFLVSGKGDLFCGNEEQLAREVFGKPSVQNELFTEEKTEAALPLRENTVSASAAPQPVKPTEIFPVDTPKKIKRIILFFEDGTFEDYIK